MAINHLRYYFVLAVFRLKENFTDLKATGITYSLYCFFIWLLSHVWSRFQSSHSHFTYETVFLYVGITEMLFMSFISTRAISSGVEDFALFLARPRSWIGREIASNIGANFGRRLAFLGTLLIFSQLLQIQYSDYFLFLLRSLLLLVLLALPQALLASLFSALRLSYPQTEYFILPFSKPFFIPRRSLWPLK